ncbi:MAG: prepilin-type N-terminal cleavage/methylation domain-containing protein [Nitrospirae bacterium]|nr:prepilin-type N-terminal cleavage/methylation domain-containing protein [Nitrospirota bacterium]
MAIQDKTQNMTLNMTQNMTMILNSRRGFTLIEVLIAISIVTLMLIALYGSFFLSRRAIEAVDDSLIRLQEIRMTLDIVRRETESALYEKQTPYSNIKIKDRDEYGRQTSELSLTTFSPLCRGLCSVSYYMKRKNGKFILMKDIRSAYQDKETDKKNESELIEDIETFTVEARDGKKWLRTWDSREAGKTPDEIRVAIAVNINGRIIDIYEQAAPKIGRRI